MNLRERVDGGLAERSARLGQMGVQVGGAVSEIPPTAFIKHEPADAVPAFDQFQEDGNDRLFFARGQPIEKGRADHVDASEKVAARVPGAEPIVDVDEPTRGGINGDVQGGAGAAQGEGDKVSSVVMVGDQRLEREVREDVPIVNDEGFGAIQKIAHIGDAARCFQAFRSFIAKVQGDALMKCGGKSLGVSVREVVGIDDDVTCSRGDDMVKGGADEGPMIERDEGFG